MASSSLAASSGSAGQPRQIATEKKARKKSRLHCEGAEVEGGRRQASSGARYKARGTPTADKMGLTRHRRRNAVHHVAVFLSGSSPADAPLARPF